MSSLRKRAEKDVVAMNVKLDYSHTQLDRQLIAKLELKALALLGKDEWIPCSQVALLTAIYYPHLFDALERR